MQISKKDYDNLKLENLYLKQELANIKRMLFGKKSERFVSTETDGQLSLFNSLEKNTNDISNVKIEETT